MTRSPKNPLFGAPKNDPLFGAPKNDPLFGAPKNDPLFGAAVLKLSFILKGAADEPGFRVVYFGTLKELGLTDAQVSEYIAANQEQLERHIRRNAQTD